jgi:hypothetical protein
MEIRKTLKFTRTLGITLPKRYSDALGLRWRDYVEISLLDKDTIAIRRHEQTVQLPNLQGELGGTVQVLVTARDD